MEQTNKFNKLFPKKPIIGMIHLAGKTKNERVSRALEEMIIYEEEGVNGVIIEDYHGVPMDVINVLRESSKIGFNIIRGVNILSDPYFGFELADMYGIKFIQFDSVQTPDLNLKKYNQLRKDYPTIIVLGGVGFKYTNPIGNPLESDLGEAKSRCEAIVTTGTGTGIETPTEKLKQYKNLLKDFPLIIGSGVKIKNVYEQLNIADGAIIGSYFKPKKNTHLPIDRIKVKDLIDVVKNVREDNFQ